MGGTSKKQEQGRLFVVGKETLRLDAKRLL